MGGPLARSSSLYSDVVQTRDGDSVPDLALRFYGRTSGGVVEAIWDHNRGLAAYGDVLPAGLDVYMPPAPSAEAAEPVRLWT